MASAAALLLAKADEDLPLGAVVVLAAQRHEGGEGLVQPDPVPPAHRDEVAEPHVGELVVDDLGEPLQLDPGWCRSGSASRIASRKVTQPRFSIAPAAKSGRATRSSFSAGIGDGEVVRVRSAGRGRRPRAAGRSGAPCRGRGPPGARSPSTSDGSVSLERARRRRRRGRSTSRSCRRSGPGGRRRGAPRRRSRARSRRRAVPAGASRVDREDRLAVRLVEAGERPAGVGLLELGRRDGPARRRSSSHEGAAVEAAEPVVQDPREAAAKSVPPGAEGHARPEADLLGRPVELDPGRAPGAERLAAGGPSGRHLGVVHLELGGVAEDPVHLARGPRARSGRCP